MALIVKTKLHYYTTISAFLLVSVSAFFSIYGLSHLFAGAKISIIIMASVLELAKVICVSFLYQFWKNIPKIIKIYLIPSITILMLITSLGIYGYLSNAYSSSSINIEIVENKIKSIIQKEQLHNNRINLYTKQMDFNKKRIDTLNNQRENQEKRLNDSILLNSRKQIDNFRKDINNSNIEINDINKKNNELMDSISKEQIEINKIKEEQLSLENSNKKIDIGPLRFLSKIFNVSMDKIVNFLILILIFVFDPLAIVLIISTNIILNKKDEVSQIKSQDNTISPIVQDNKTIELPEIKEEIEEKEDYVETSEEIKEKIKNIYNEWKIKKNKLKDN